MKKNLIFVFLYFLYFTGFGFGVELNTAIDISDIPVVSSDAPWIYQELMSNDGIDAAESALIGNSQSTWFEISVVGPGSFEFYWKISSEPEWDVLSLTINGDSAREISGEQDWTLVEMPLASGTNILRWTYTKDSTSSQGQDRAWIDELQITRIFEKNLTFGHDEFGNIARIDYETGGNQGYSMLVASTHLSTSEPRNEELLRIIDNSTDRVGSVDILDYMANHVRGFFTVEDFLDLGEHDIAFPVDDEFDNEDITVFFDTLHLPIPLPVNSTWNILIETRDGSGNLIEETNGQLRFILRNISGTDYEGEYTIEPPILAIENGIASGVLEIKSAIELNEDVRIAVFLEDDVDMQSSVASVRTFKNYQIEDDIDIQSRVASVRTGYDLRLMSVTAPAELTDRGESLIIVALVDGDLHIRIFDANGRAAVDKTESELVSGPDLNTLKALLNEAPFPDASRLSEKAKTDIIEKALRTSQDSQIVTEWDGEISLDSYRDSTSVYSHPLGLGVPVQLAGTFGEWRPPGFNANYVYKPGSLHWGIDLKAPKDTEVFASKKGIVSAIGKSRNNMVVDHGNGWATRYIHIVPEKSVGEIVDKGDQIATIQNISSAHLHFELVRKHGGVKEWQRGKVFPGERINPVTADFAPILTAQDRASPKFKKIAFRVLNPKLDLEDNFRHPLFETNAKYIRIQVVDEEGDHKLVPRKITYTPDPPQKELSIVFDEETAVKELDSEAEVGYAQLTVRADANRTDWYQFGFPFDATAYEDLEDGPKTIDFTIEDTHGNSPTTKLTIGPELQDFSTTAFDASTTSTFTFKTKCHFGPFPGAGSAGDVIELELDNSELFGYNAEFVSSGTGALTLPETTHESISETIEVKLIPDGTPAKGGRIGVVAKSSVFEGISDGAGVYITPADSWTGRMALDPGVDTSRPSYVPFTLFDSSWGRSSSISFTRDNKLPSNFCSEFQIGGNFRGDAAQGFDANFMADNSFEVTFYTLAVGTDPSRATFRATNVTDASMEGTFSGVVTGNDFSIPYSGTWLVSRVGQVTKYCPPELTVKPFDFPRP